jgi:competence protein ComEA
MKSINLILKTLFLALCLSQMALAASTETVNINTADAATLDRVLVGIGPSKAQAIVAYRKANGAFKSVNALADVKGIGPSTIERNAGRISVGGKAPVKPAVPAKKAAAR